MPTLQLEQVDISVELMKMVPIITGSVLAIAGVVVTQFLTHHYNAKRERNKLIREKAELLCDKLNSLYEWLLEKKTKVVSKEEGDESLPPYIPARTLQKLYFPELQKELEDVVSETLKVSEVISDAGRAISRASFQIKAAEIKEEGQIAAIEAKTEIFNKVNEQILESFGPFFAAVAVAINGVIRVVEERIKV